MLSKLNDELNLITLIKICQPNEIVDHFFATHRITMTHVAMHVLCIISAVFTTILQALKTNCLPNTELENRYYFQLAFAEQTFKNDASISQILVNVCNNNNLFPSSKRFPSISNHRVAEI